MKSSARHNGSVWIPPGSVRNELRVAVCCLLGALLLATSEAPFLSTAVVSILGLVGGIALLLALSAWREVRRVERLGVDPEVIDTFD